MKKGQIHTHTKASDGWITPEDVLESKLDFVAITDHDSVRSIPEFERLERQGIAVIPGIELTTKHMGKGVHILVYYPEYQSDFLDCLHKIGILRTERAHKSAARLRELGFYCPAEDLLQCNGILTKGSIADIVFGYTCNTPALEAQGFTEQRKFIKHYLEEGGAASFKLPRTEFSELCKLVDGIKVLAHPGHDLEPGRDDYIIEDLAKNYCVIGIEANSRKHKNGQTEYYNRLAEKLGLIATTSADAHRKEQLTQNTIDYSVIENLKEKIPAVR